MVYILVPSSWTVQPCKPGYTLACFKVQSPTGLRYTIRNPLRRPCGMIRKAWLMRGPQLSAHPFFRDTSKDALDFQFGRESRDVSSLT